MGEWVGVSVSVCVCGWDLQLCLCPCIFYECRGYVHRWGRGLGVTLCVRVSVCVEDKDLANQPGLVDR